MRGERKEKVTRALWKVSDNSVLLIGGSSIKILLLSPMSCCTDCMHQIWYLSFSYDHNLRLYLATPYSHIHTHFVGFNLSIHSYLYLVGFNL